MNALPGGSGREVVERVYKDAASNDPAGNSSAAAMCQPVSDADLIAIQVLVDNCTNEQVGIVTCFRKSLFGLYIIYLLRCPLV